MGREKERQTDRQSLPHSVDSDLLVKSHGERSAQRKACAVSVTCSTEGLLSGLCWCMSYSEVAALEMNYCTYVWLALYKYVAKR